ncbi:hypothetical protein KY334_05350 [Candidatus Woesearchaeota archaeon]|nr:hypothetical protein [Candidatus Woesearchaeota archaeon]
MTTTDKSWIKEQRLKVLKQLATVGLAGAVLIGGTYACRRDSALEDRLVKLEQNQNNNNNNYNNNNSYVGGNEVKSEQYTLQDLAKERGVLLSHLRNLESYHNAVQNNYESAKNQEKARMVEQFFKLGSYAIKTVAKKEDLEARGRSNREIDAAVYRDIARNSGNLSRSAYRIFLSGGNIREYNININQIANTSLASVKEDIAYWEKVDPNTSISQNDLENYRLRMISDSAENGLTYGSKGSYSSGRQKVSRLRGRR